MKDGVNKAEMGDKMAKLAKNNMVRLENSTMTSNLAMASVNKT